MNKSLLLCFSLLLGATALAQEPATKVRAVATQRTVEQVLEGESDWGRQAWTGITSRVIKGAVEIPETHASGTFESSEAQQPGRIGLLLKFANGTVAEGGFDG